MTKYILHGGYTGEPNELNKSFYREITKGLQEKKKIFLECLSKIKVEL